MVQRDSTYIWQTISADLFTRMWNCVRNGRVVSRAVFRWAEGSLRRGDRIFRKRWSLPEDWNFKLGNFGFKFEISRSKIHVRAWIESCLNRKLWLRKFVCWKAFFSWHCGYWLDTFNRPLTGGVAMKYFGIIYTEHSLQNLAFGKVNLYLLS